jgi:prepilin-type N-terminal cleavage/methylation domain-containing protein/prepilin-type processing-associated H-X9-DG protein
MRRDCGFTLIELLVVIAIIALLLAIVIPSLKTAKEYATGALCLNNQKQLSLAWYSYQSDNSNQIVGGSTYSRADRSWGPTDSRWCEKPLFRQGDDPEKVAAPAPAQMTLETRINGIRTGKLFPYTLDEKLYHCPNDKNYLKQDTAYAIYRSYSISGLMNGEDFAAFSGDQITGYRSISNFPGGTRTLICVTKMTQIRSPGNKYVFVEENATKEGTTQSRKQNYLLGGFVLMNGNNYNSWWDFPAYYHNDMSTLGFADGHAEKHIWRDKRTIDLMRNPNYWDFIQVNPLNDDLVWMIRGYVPD